MDAVEKATGHNYMGHNYMSHNFADHTGYYCIR